MRLVSQDEVSHLDIQNEALYTLLWLYNENNIVLKHNSPGRSFSIIATQGRKRVNVSLITIAFFYFEPNLFPHNVPLALTLASLDQLI